MENLRPSVVEIRAVFPVVGIGSMIGLAGWADTAVDRHLWTQDWFRGALIFFACIALLGLWEFIAHWKWRSIPPALNFAVIAAVVFHRSPPEVYALLLLAFLVTAYFVSPDRLPKFRPATDSNLNFNIVERNGDNGNAVKHPSSSNQRFDLIEVAAKAAIKEAERIKSDAEHTLVKK